MSLSWAYGTPPSDAEGEGEALLGRALDMGYNHLDTANSYGMGHSETRIGNALKGRRHEFFLATKMGIVVQGVSRGVDCSPSAKAHSSSVVSIDAPVIHSPLAMETY